MVVVTEFASGGGGSPQQSHKGAAVGKNEVFVRKGSWELRIFVGLYSSYKCFEVQKMG